MFSIEKNNKKVGAHLRKLIEKRYPNVRSFCKEYLRAEKMPVNDDEIRKMHNRFSQILNGNKAIQTYDLPFVSELLGVSCEEILSAGKHCVKTTAHVTNYDIAASESKAVWDKYMKREDKLFLYSDEYCKNVLDYALEFKNYKFIKYLIDEGFIIFNRAKDCTEAFMGYYCSAKTSLKSDFHRLRKGDLNHSLVWDVDLRIKLITLAIENNDIDVLESMEAMRIPEISPDNNFLHYADDTFSDSRNPDFLEALASSQNENIIDYFSSEYELTLLHKKETHTFMFAFMSEVIDLMLEKGNYSTAEIFIRRAIRHNRTIYDKMNQIIQYAAVAYCDFYNFSSKFSNEEDYKKECQKIHPACYMLYNSFNHIIYFRSHRMKQNHDPEDITNVMSNIVQVKSDKGNSILKELVIELNQTYDSIIDIYNSGWCNELSILS